MKRRRGTGIVDLLLGSEGLRGDKRLIIKDYVMKQQLLRERTREAAIALLLCLAPAAAFAQLDAAQIRGSVVDEKGQPIPGVAVELKFRGETRAPLVKTTTTDKKGGFIRVGLKGGDWTLTFTKDGYKTVGIDTYLSIGGLSASPTVTMEAAKPAPAAAVKNPAAEAEAATAERAKQLGAAYMSALEALQAGQSADAEAKFKALIQELPDLAEAHYNLGYLYEQRGAVAEAEAEFRKAFTLQPQNAPALVAVATLVDRRGAGEEALKLLEENGPRFAENAKVQFALGATAFNIGRNAVAEPAFEKAAALDPANAETLFFLGSIALGRSDVPTAIARLEKFVAAAAPTSPNLETAKALLATLKKKK
jgi:tetratricopeptide (TPR) repeat protein